MKWKTLPVILFTMLVSIPVHAQNPQADQMQVYPSLGTQQSPTGMDAGSYSPFLPPALTYPGQMSVIQQPGVPLLQQPQEQPGTERFLPRRLPPAAEKPSEFEQFVAGKIEITEDQFDILKQDGGITYSQDRPAVSEGKISVPVKIFGEPKKVKEMQGYFTPIEINAPSVVIGVGYLTGTPEAIAGAFKLLGIRSRYAIDTELKQFGYDFFLMTPYAFTPPDKFPVGPDYVLGPGDEVKVTIWGKIDGRFNLVVDRDGMITLPKAAMISVAGLTFKEAKEVIQKEYSKYFSGFEMNVSLGALRTITVYVVGNVQWPGSYSISSLSTIVNALFAAGGPSKSGSMRDIQVKRNGEEVVHFDLYDLLLKGDKTNDIRLMPQDEDQFRRRQERMEERSPSGGIEVK